MVDGKKFWIEKGNFHSFAEKIDKMLNLPHNIKTTCPHFYSTGEKVYENAYIYWRPLDVL